MAALFDDAFEFMATKLLATLGEECTYFPKSGGSRSLTAAVDEMGTFETNAQGRDSEEVIRVYVLRDADDATYGGIDNPQIGDAFHIDRDPDDRVFTWKGERRDVSRHSWVLMFHRRLPYSRGGGR